MSFRNHWKKHSLSIVSIAVGVTAVIAVIPLGEGTAFDIFSGIGTAFLGTGIFGVLSGWLTEKNKPEEDAIERKKREHADDHISEP